MIILFKQMIMHSKYLTIIQQSERQNYSTCSGL